MSETAFALIFTIFITSEDSATTLFMCFRMNATGFLVEEIHFPITLRKKTKIHWMTFPGMRSVKCFKIYLDSYK